MQDHARSITHVVWRHKYRLAESRCKASKKVRKKYFRLCGHLKSGLSKSFYNSLQERVLFLSPSPGTGHPHRKKSEINWCRIQNKHVNVGLGSKSSKWKIHGRGIKCNSIEWDMSQTKITTQQNRSDLHNDDFIFSNHIFISSFSTYISVTIKNPPA